MTFDLLALIALVFAAIPGGLFLLNLLIYRPLPRGRQLEEAPTSTSESQNEPSRGGTGGVSVLIPARNEEQNIRATLEAVLANRDVEFEVIVLDDHSTDDTVKIVSWFASRDPRVRLESAPPLPSGWCGKQHACHILAKLARHPLLVFLDADVRLAPDALARMAAFMNDGRRAPIQPGKMSRIDTPCRRTALPAALASGVPRQELGTFSERLLLPLIHFILLGYLPIPLMRWTRKIGFSAGCGQLFVTHADAYHAVGGHAVIRATLHDGVKLPRAFRRAGFHTDLFDATDLATCRMYRTNGETWRGLGKNAVEGLAAPGTILPMTTLLVGGQVLPLALLALAPRMSSTGMILAALASALAFLPRLVAVWRFRQPLGSALLHPFGVLALLAIQWHALLRHLAHRPAEWKGRSYSATPRIEPARTA